MKTILGLLLIVLITSCSTSNDVASHRSIQKRKYTKGFFITKNLNQNGTASNSKNSQIKNEISERLDEKNSTKPSNESFSEQQSLISNEDDLENITPKEIKSKHVSSNKTSTLKELSLKDASEAKTTSNPINKIKDVKKKISLKAPQPASDVETILLILLAIFIPPLAVFIYEGASKRFWIDLILALLGWGFLGWLLPGLFWIGGLIAIIYALLIVTGTI
jgi:uncharacterized membrane protein YqaE (UPF0057 family)